MRAPAPHDKLLEEIDTLQARIKELENERDESRLLLGDKLVKAQARIKELEGKVK